MIRFLAPVSGILAQTPYNSNYDPCLDLNYALLFASSFIAYFMSATISPTFALLRGVNE